MEFRDDTQMWGACLRIYPALILLKLILVSAQWIRELSEWWVLLHRKSNANPRNDIISSYGRRVAC
jgi:hypothetical protein